MTDHYEVRILNDLGIKGYGAGPNVHVHDLYALSDPLLARIPSNPGESSPGYLGRSMPAGYLETLWTGENRIEDPALHQYYNRLKLVISGDLWSTERLKEVFMMNFGKHDDLMEEYLKRNPMN